MTIRRIPSGSWMIDINIRKPDGSWIRVRKVSPVQTKRGAAQYEREVRAAVLSRSGAKEEKRKPVRTFASFAGFFIDTYATTNNRPSTVREKRRALGRGLLDELGRLRLDQISARHVEGFKARRKKDGVAPKTINEELAILSKILGYAEEIGELTTQPPKIRRLKAQKPAFDFLDFKEGNRLLQAAARAPQPWCAMIPTAMLTGLRLGELRALRWDDVDLVAARLHVRQAADDVNVLHPPKSGQSRVVDLPRKAVELLGAHQQHARGELVFSREDGSMLQRWECESKTKAAKHDHALAKACRAAGLRRIGWHALRHTYASHLVMSGAGLLEVKELLGHASLEMTMRYAHLSPGARRRAVELLDGADSRQHSGNGDPSDEFNPRNS
ncbi:tyrosine-type recombinase/integrase [Paraliomyxa miuraensis]|uniref:tyrosine-type recombinase/integrase n=1 Tax=Paraliomyxa miuraensis TaxID=376150 RepID=UPI002259E9BA|nr:site-specific integrase [Paraliomyxa miuraensis]MCX4239752.1 site-specific integrase [Paraliomyxa miuraensis]